METPLRMDFQMCSQLRILGVSVWNLVVRFLLLGGVDHRFLFLWRW